MPGILLGSSIFRTSFSSLCCGQHNQRNLHTGGVAMSHVIYPTTNLKATEQMLVDRGEGVYIYDSNGKQYLEGLAGHAAAARLR